MESEYSWLGNWFGLRYHSGWALRGVSKGCLQSHFQLWVEQDRLCSLLKSVPQCWISNLGWKRLNSSLALNLKTGRSVNLRTIPRSYFLQESSHVHTRTHTHKIHIFYIIYCYSAVKGTISAKCLLNSPLVANSMDITVIRE